MVIRLHGTDCAVCGDPCLYGKRYRNSPDYLTIDHANPKAFGGSNHLENLRPAHRRCNAMLGRMTDDQIRDSEMEWAV